MTNKRIIPCLDVKDGRVVKGQQFRDLKALDSPVSLARRYCQEGADELVFYDITASLEGRHVFTDILRETLKEVSIPLTVGGGISNLEDIELMFSLGADKVSINSAAIRRPTLIAEAAKQYGSRRVVLGVDVKQLGDSYHVFTSGGQEDTGLDAIQWIRRCVDLGAGEIVVNAIDTDGMRQGFHLPLLKLVTEAVRVPVIASGGAGSIEHFVALFQQLPAVDAGLAASVFHLNEVSIPALKEQLKAAGIPVSMPA